MNCKEDGMNWKKLKMSKKSEKWSLLKKFKTIQQNKMYKKI